MIVPGEATPLDPFAPCMEAPIDIQNFAQHWPGVLFRQRLDLTFEFASPRLAELTGFTLERWQRDPDLLLKVLHESDSENFRLRLARVAQVPEGFSQDFRLRHAITGSVAYLTEFRRPLFDDTGRLTGYEGFWTDHTRLTISERRLATAAWKETLGLLTLGLAHDFNNAIGGILGLSEAYHSQTTPEHPFHEGLGLLKKSAHQAAQIIQRLVQLHQIRSGSRSYHDLNALVTEAADLIGKVIPKRIELSAQLAGVPLPIYADAAEIHQTLLNLALNSAEAMPERGRLVLTTALHAEVSAREYAIGARPRLPAVSVSVSDTGAGIKARHLPFIFEPFFTTKPMNKGSGLGLYNARLCLEKHAGAITVETAEGAGTTFHLWLPQSDFTEADTAHELATHRLPSLLLVGEPGGAIDAAAAHLRAHHFHVVVVMPADAEDHLRTGDYAFDAVLLRVEPRDDTLLPLIQFLQRQKLPLKIIVETLGTNPDEIDPRYVERADLILTADESAEKILRRLTELLDVKR